MITSHTLSVGRGDHYLPGRIKHAQASVWGCGGADLRDLSSITRICVISAFMQFGTLHYIFCLRDG